MTGQSLRLFVAITLPEPILDALGGALATVAALAPGARATPRHNLHLTLCFLGWTARQEQPHLAALLDRVAAATAPFPLAVEGAGAFGPASHPRVLWAGVTTGKDAITAVAEAVQGAIAPTAQEARPYSPHVTLARARAPRGDRDLARALRALDGFAAGSFPVGSLVLMESQLTQQGSRYQILHEARFPA